MYKPKITNTKSSLDTYLELVELTEPPLLYHRWCFLSVVGAAIGRNIWMPFGDDNIYPNQFVTLIGPPGARKSTAIKAATNMLRDSGYEYFSGDTSSKEQFLVDWEHGFDKIAKGIEPGTKPEEIDLVSAMIEEKGIDADTVSPAYIAAGELQDFLGSGNNQFIVTLTNLWDNLDKFSGRYKNSKNLLIPNPTINMIGGATTTTFSHIFSASIIGQGMLSRMMLVHGRGQRMRLTIPPKLNPELRAVIVKLLFMIRTDLRGPVHVGSEAQSAIDDVYTSFDELPDARLASYSSRRLTHLLKVCITIAASELRLEITKDDVILANSILTYTENFMPKALGEFGKSRSSEVSQVVLEAISAAGLYDPPGITITELIKLVSQDVDSIHELATITMKLDTASKIRVGKRGDQSVFLPVKKEVKTRTKHVDLDLLWEHKLGENS